MKKLVSFVLVLTVVMTFLSGTAYAKETNTITVNGSGKVYAVPDTALVYLGATATDKDAKIAQNRANEIMNKVVSEVKKLGIDEKDIKTQYVSVYPNYDEKSNITGYIANNSVTVTVKDISKVGEIIDVSVENGANSNSGLNFTISDPEKYYNEAIVAAIGNAKAKGDTIANTLGVKVKGVINVVEMGDMYISPMYAQKLANDSTESGSTQVSAGEIEINASVQLVLEY